MAGSSSGVYLAISDVAPRTSPGLHAFMTRGGPSLSTPRPGPTPTPTACATPTARRSSTRPAPAAAARSTTPATSASTTCSGAGTPSSSVPDERAFVIVHQLCEVVFKQMTFDLAVVTATFERVLEAAEGGPGGAGAGRGRGGRAALDGGGGLAPGDHGLEPAAPRRPAPAAAHHGADGTQRRATTCCSRASSSPTSGRTSSRRRGFQAAQLRLIQRALGKGPLLDLRVFPGDAYGHHYAGVALRPRVPRRPARAPGEAPRWPRRRHRIRPRGRRGSTRPHTRCWQRSPTSATTFRRRRPSRRIHDADVDRAVDRFRATLGPAGHDGPGAAARRRRHFPVRPRGRGHGRERTSRRAGRRLGAAPTTSRPERRPERARPRSRPHRRDRRRAPRSLRRHVPDGPPPDGPPPRRRRLGHGRRRDAVPRHEPALPAPSLPCLVAWQDLEL